MAYFNDPKVRIQEELDDLREDIGHREKEIRRVKVEISDLEKRQELLDSELEELFASEKKLTREAMRLKLDN
jgi:cell division protein FtsL